MLIIEIILGIVGAWFLLGLMAEGGGGFLLAIITLLVIAAIWFGGC